MANTSLVWFCFSPEESFFALPFRKKTACCFGMFSPYFSNEVSLDRGMQIHPPNWPRIKSSSVPGQFSSGQGVGLPWHQPWSQVVIPRAPSLWVSCARTRCWILVKLLGLAVLPLNRSSWSFGRSIGQAPAVVGFGHSKLFQDSGKLLITKWFDSFPRDTLVISVDSITEDRQLHGGMPMIFAVSAGYRLPPLTDMWTKGQQLCEVIPQHTAIRFNVR